MDEEEMNKYYIIMDELKIGTYHELKALKYADWQIAAEEGCETWEEAKQQIVTYYTEMLKCAKYNLTHAKAIRKRA